MNKNYVYRLVTLLIIITQITLASKLQTLAYFQALDQAFHSLGSQKVFIVKPKKCFDSCQKTIKDTQEIIRQMNLLRTVPFIVADAFSKNQNLQIRLYDQNGKLSGSLMSDRTMMIPQSKIKALLNDRLLETQPKAKTVTIQDFLVQQLQGSGQIINHYDTQIKRKRVENDQKYLSMNSKSKKISEQSQSIVEKQIVVDQQSLSKQQIRKMVSQQVLKSIDKQQLAQLVKRGIQGEGTLTQQLSTMKDQFSNLRKQLSTKQAQIQNYVKQKRSLEKQETKPLLQNINKVPLTEQVKTQEIYDQTLLLKGALIIIALLACYIFVNCRRKENQRSSYFRSVPNNQSFQSI